MLGVHTSGRAAPEAAELSPDVTLSWKEVVGSVDPFLKAVIQRLQEQIQEFDPDIATYAQYALTGQGKQLRPALVALSAEATGQLNDDHVMVAVIIEMVHLATLVHDDVMDEASIRRGRPTLAANWGNEISVLLGDCLFAHALKLAASFPTTEICRAVASATNTVCAGEILQTQLRKNFELSRAEYFKVVSMKTGELFALSCDLGAFLSGSPDLQRTALRQYGMAIGTAYQIYDDCLDLFGTEADAGKSLGTDLAKGKLTLPMLYLLERVEPGKREEVRSLLMEWEPSSFPQVTALLREHGALEFSCEAIAQYLNGARQSLSPVPPCRGLTGLLGLSGYLAQQASTLRSSN